MSEKEFDKNKLLEEFNNKLADECDNTGYFFHMFYKIKGTDLEAELMNTKYSLIEAKFTRILNKLSEIDDDDWKIESFIDLISSVKDTRLLSRKKRKNK